MDTYVRTVILFVIFVISEVKGQGQLVKLDSVMLENEQTVKAQISMCRCAGWSEPSLTASQENPFIILPGCGSGSTYMATSSRLDGWMD